MHERGDDEALYNLGVMENVRMTLGRRWYLVWMHGFVESELPHDGIHWETVLERSIKSK